MKNRKIVNKLNKLLKQLLNNNKKMIKDGKSLKTLIKKEKEDQMTYRHN